MQEKKGKDTAARVKGTLKKALEETKSIHQQKEPPYLGKKRLDNRTCKGGDARGKKRFKKKHLRTPFRSSPCFGKLPVGKQCGKKKKQPKTKIRKQK